MSVFQISQCKLLGTLARLGILTNGIVTEPTWQQHAHWVEVAEDRNLGCGWGCHRSNNLLSNPCLLWGSVKLKVTLLRRQGVPSSGKAWVRCCKARQDLAVKCSQRKSLCYDCYWRTSHYHAKGLWAWLLPRNVRYLYIFIRAIIPQWQAQAKQTLASNTSASFVTKSVWDFLTKSYKFQI